MNRIAKFEKVSLYQFDKDWCKIYKSCESEIIPGRCTYTYDILDDIKLPQRATMGSAGYDFFSPINFSLKPGETKILPTGVRVCIEPGWVLKMYPRSGLGFKYRLQLNNTVGIIDSDYYYSDNEGHIFCKITNDSNENKTVEIKEGEAFCQGVFVPYGITIDDNASGIRNGGFGSTTRSE